LGQSTFNKSWEDISLLVGETSLKSMNFFFSFNFSYKKKIIFTVCIEKSIVLKPGLTRRVDPGPGRPGHGTGPSLSKNPPGSWPSETRSTRDPAGSGKPGWDSTSFFYICIKVKRRIWTMHWCKIATITNRENIIKEKQFQSWRAVE
jgi:hypothetical protein